MNKTRRKLLRPISRRALVVLLVWLVSLGVAFAAGVYVHRNRAQIRALFESVQESPIVQTNLYNLRVEMVAVPAEGRDGGIAALDGGILFVNREGEFSYVDADRRVNPLSLRVPLNVPEFLADPYNENTTGRELFGVKDLLVQRLPGRLRILTSHNHWYAEEDCNTLRVSAAELPLGELLDGAAEGTWSTVYETRPCRPLAERRDGTRMPSLGAGGRLVGLSEDEVLLSVGGLGPETDLSGTTDDGDPNSYGKTIVIDVESGEDRIHTRGHRNPQGLAVGPDGTVWETEHGDRGGDELNRLIHGRHYGYPHVSYGTAYESMVWPGNPVQGRHDGYEQPMFAWTPGIGISQLVVLEGDAFPYWRGDLVLGSLKERSLYRVRIEDDRVVLVEKIPMGHRIRDIVEADDGTLVLKSDGGFLVYVEPLDASDPSELTPVEYGTVLATQCQACHTFSRGGASGIGPNLWGVVGRPVAALDEFDYSDAMDEHGGRWTPDALRAFLAHPDSVVPGTRMTLTTRYDAEQVDALVAYLESLQ